MTRKLRVCHIITQLELGGAQDNTLTTVESLPPDRYETFLISGPGGILDDRARTRLGARCQFVPSLIREICPFRDTAAFFSLRKLFIEGRYNIVHTHSSKAGVVGRLAAASAGVPILLHTAHGWGFHDRQPALLRNIFIACERVAARFSRIIVAVSESTVRKGLDAGIGRPGQYVVIRSGIDPKLPDHVKAELKRPPMSAYNSWKQLDQGSLGLVRGKAGVMKLPGGAALKLLLEGVEEKDGKRYAVSASITKDGKDFLPGAQFKARGGKTFFVGGIEHKGGVLFLGITIQ